MARQKAALARELVAKNGSARERTHVETLALAIEGQLPAALDAALKHIEACPRDAIRRTSTKIAAGYRSPATQQTQSPGGRRC